MHVICFFNTTICLPSTSPRLETFTIHPRETSFLPLLRWHCFSPHRLMRGTPIAPATRQWTYRVCASVEGASLTYILYVYRHEYYTPQLSTVSYSPSKGERKGGPKEGPSPACLKSHRPSCSCRVMPLQLLTCLHTAYCTVGDVQ